MASNPLPFSLVDCGDQPPQAYAASPPTRVSITYPVRLLIFDDGDTFAYLDPAPEERHLAKFRHLPHRVHSNKLLATGSAHFQRLFEPQYQTRVQRQRGFVNGLPEGIKYVIDLSPLWVDDKALIGLSELTCPLGIRVWALLQPIWSLPDSCVGGADDMEERPCDRAALSKELALLRRDAGPPLGSRILTHLSKEYSATRHRQVIRQVLHVLEGRPRLPKKYSATRHRQAIEQVLHVLEGLTITLDTPCKLWSFHAVAKLFEVATVPVISGYITAWFYESANTRFIEFHPDIAYRVACGVEASGLCRHAFVELVADEALLYIMRSTTSTTINPTGPSFTRNLGDTDARRIEYASKSFADRVIDHFLHVAGHGMEWLAQVPEFEKPNQHLQKFPGDFQVVAELVLALFDLVRFRIFETLKNLGDPRRSCEAIPSNKHTHHRASFRVHDTVQRLMGKRFWQDLRQLSMDPLPLPEIHGKGPMSIAELGRGLPAFLGHEEAKIKQVTRTWADEKAQRYNRALFLHGRALGGPLTFAEKRECQEMGLTIELPNLEALLGADEVMGNTIDLDLLFLQIRSYISKHAEKMVCPHELDAPQLGATETLTCLANSEYRFLPSWAGGMDPAG